MMPPLNTSVAVAPLPFTLDFERPVVTVGSCFADEMSSRMAAGGFPVCANPFGTLYNPASMAAALQRVLDRRPLVEADTVQHDGLVHSWHHHGRFSRPSLQETLAACNAAIDEAHSALKTAQLLLLTFGTAWVFELNGQAPAPDEPVPFVVANCHKLPAIWFNRRRLSVDEIVSLWRPLLEKLASFNPDLSVLFTVSPVRHMADGAHGNQLSKSVLLIAVEELLSAAEAVPLPLCYFPAYELILDELRDYRFFGADMVHPSPLAADIVWDRLQQACLSPAQRQQVHDRTKQARRAGHRPLHG